MQLSAVSHLATLVLCSHHAVVSCLTPGIPVFLQVEPLEMENSKGILKPAQSITFYMDLSASQSEGLFYHCVSCLFVSFPVS